MKEKPIDKLDRVIGLLSQSKYTAPDNWESIESELELLEGIKQLPRYQAPDSAWNTIANELDKEQQADVSTHQQRNNWLLVGVGIVLGVLLVMIIQYWSNKNSTPDYKYKSEVEMASLFSEKIELDQEVDDIILYIRDNRFLFDKDVLDAFNVQLQEINTALLELKTMQSNYGIDISSNQMMARVETERAELLKSMISNI